MSERVAIIAAMEREIAPLVRGWKQVGLKVEGQSWELTAFESNRARVVVSGIGPAHAGRAAEAVIAGERPSVVVSAGLAGALDAGLSVGAILQPETVWDAGSGERFSAEGRGALVSAGRVLDVAGKRALAARYRADAVDMEAAAVAAAARRHGVRFLAFKAISDDPAFPMPSFEPFIDARGKLHPGRLALSGVIRPALWPVLWRLRANTRHASQELCCALVHLIQKEERGLSVPALVKQESR